MADSQTQYPPVPPDDLSRNLAVANPDHEGKLPHIGLVGDTYTITIDGDDTKGQFCVVDMHIPAGGGPGPHRHIFEETFIVLDGEIEATFRGKKSIVHAGETVNIPSNAPHMFHNTSANPARVICICSPAGQEKFFLEIGVPVATRTTAPPRLDDKQMMQFAQQVLARHGDRHPELVEVQELVRALGEELLVHTGKEEAVLFPYITNLERNLRRCGPPALGCFGTVKTPIRVMLADHEAAGEMMAQIREATGNYTAPADACPTWQGFYQALYEFERDLHQHVHLENNILFPRAIELEESCG